MALRAGLTIDDFRGRGDGHLPGLLGIRAVALAEGMIEMELDVRAEVLAPNGYLHAATVVGLADTASGYGCIAHLPAGAVNFTTIELKSNFLGTAQSGTIACTARPAHLGRNTQVWDATVIHRETGKTIALFRCTQMILWPKN
ncbi:MAG: PaaI family thioesterase [Betaproteobacteria bacterium]